MIDTDTVRFIHFLSELAEGSKNGIHPFSKATPEQKDGLLYDDEKPIYEEPHYATYPLIAMFIIDNEHHDIIATYTNVCVVDDIEVTVHKDGSDVYVSVVSKNDPELDIVVENGSWYMT